jgi:23S rRNA pseudouridine1911/1915/1917 synthase
MLFPLYKNNQLIAFSKPAGIGVQPDKTDETSFQQQAEAYCQHPLYVVHRIDRPVSGLVVFAKTKTAVRSLNEQFQARSVEKIYLAVVSAAPAEPEATLVHFIQKNESKNRTSVSTEPREGLDRAEMHYRLVGSSDRYHLLEIRLITGRHHQIRAQLAAIGCPVKGDVKYGARRGNTDRSIHLHAWRIGLSHPVSGERFIIEAPLPTGDAVWDFFREKISPS